MEGRLWSSTTSRLSVGRDMRDTIPLEIRFALGVLCDLLSCVVIDGVRSEVGQSVATCGGFGIGVTGLEMCSKMMVL